MAAAVAAGAAESLLRRDYDWRTATPASRLCSMALERAAPERRRQKRRARRAVEVHPTAEWLRAAAEEASATPPPHQEQRGRPGSARELADFEANLARVRPPAGPSSVEAHLACMYKQGFPRTLPGFLSMFPASFPTARGPNRRIVLSVGLFGVGLGVA